jgi:hypothetical protein
VSALRGEGVVLADRADRGCRARREGGVDAAERGFVATIAGERPRKSGEVSGGRLRPAGVVRVVPIDVDEQSRKRAHVLFVVADHVHQWAGLAEAKVVQVPRGDLPAGDVGLTTQPEELALDRRESRIAHAVSEDAAHERQEVKVASVQRRVRAGHPVPGDEEGPVEATAVVRDEPAVARDVSRELVEQGRLIGMVRQQQLDLPEAAALPPAETDEEREGPRRGREARGLRIEAEQGSVCRRLPR